MDENGRTRISDLGLACLITPNLRGACGTRGYMAPEMLVRDALGNPLVYNEAVDWFSFGCVLFELRVGCSPFRTPYAKKWMASAVPLNPSAQRTSAGLVAGGNGNNNGAGGTGGNENNNGGGINGAVGSNGGAVPRGVHPSSTTASESLSITKTGGAPIGAALVNLSGNTSGQQTPHTQTIDNHSAHRNIVSRTANGTVTGNNTGDGGTTRSNNNNNNLTGNGGALDPNRAPSRKEVSGKRNGRSHWRSSLWVCIS